MKRVTYRKDKSDKRQNGKSGNFTPYFCKSRRDKVEQKENEEDKVPIKLLKVTEEDGEG